MGIAIYWQHHDKDLLGERFAKLQATNQQLNGRDSSLTNQLNTANQSISKLTATDTFVPDEMCQTSQLRLAYEMSMSGGLAGDGGVFSYQNDSSTVCTVSGYPGFLALSSGGQVKPNGAISEGLIAFGSKSGNLEVPQLITLSANQKAYFVVSWGSPRGATSPSECLSPSLIESTPPGQTLPLLSAVSSNSLTMCDNVGPISPLLSQTAIDTLTQS